MRFWNFCINDFVVEDIMHSFGWYHFLWLGIMLAAIAIFTLTLAGKHNEKTDDRFVFISGAMLIAIEIFKQVFLVYEGGGFNPWYFPYQFCSVPMFVAFIAPLVRNEKVKSAMYKFLAIAGLAGGLSVMVYPESCLNTHYIVLLIHTMLWHATMVVIGIYLIVAKGYMKDLKNFFSEVKPAAIILYALSVIAVITNVVCYKAGIEINFFHISPYFETVLPVLNTIQANTPYIVFLFAYFIAFTLAMIIVWFAAFGIRSFFKKRK